jgi:hypothetical protein
VIKANAAVAQSLFNMATREKVPSAAIWWTKARMGWREATDLNVGGQKDNPVGIDFAWAPALPQPLPAATPPTIDAQAEHEPSDGAELAMQWGDP